MKRNEINGNGIKRNGLSREHAVQPADLRKLTLTAMLAALTCVATMIIKVPVPATGGYIHPGDAFVLLAGILAGRRNGFLAAGLGTALADIFSGYAIYAPAGFVIKGLCALAAALIYESSSLPPRFRSIAAFLPAVVIIPGLYFAFESVLYGAGALAEILPNIVQASSGVVLAVLLLPLIKKIASV